jgi:ketosteroid isomerase-like protein
LFLGHANVLQNATLGVTNSNLMINKVTEVARLYHETWNGRDADALVGCFTKDGTFCNPDTYPGISGEALAEFVKGLWTAVPDLSIEILNAGEIEPGLVAHHWLAKGTSEGKAFSFKGASIVRVEGDKIRSDNAYFDRKALE